jgi:hypothetical protein
MHPMFTIPICSPVVVGCIIWLLLGYLRVSKRSSQKPAPWSVAARAVPVGRVQSGLQRHWARPSFQEGCAGRIPARTAFQLLLRMALGRLHEDSTGGTARTIFDVRL